MTYVLAEFGDFGFTHTTDMMEDPKRKNMGD